MIAADPQIMSARLLRFFLKRVQDVDRLRSRRHVEHPVRGAYVNPDFPASGPTACIGFQWGCPSGC